jgi:Amt family ammonium transporter
MTLSFTTPRRFIPAHTTGFMYHMLALVIVSTFSFLGSLALFKLTDWILPIRVTKEQEAVGLDLSQHGEFMELEPMRQFGYSE